MTAPALLAVAAALYLHPLGVVSTLAETGKG